MSAKFDVIAHRGGHVTHPENTMAAFNDALQCGADGIEFDVRLTRDGIPVVIHDDGLERTTDGQGKVSELAASELAGIDAGKPFSPEFSGEQIPLLSELLEWAAGNQLQIHLELKAEMIGNDSRLAHAVTEILQSHSIADRVLMSSFNHSSLVEARRRIPELRIGLLYYFGMHEPWNYASSLDAASLNCLWNAIDRDLVDNAKSVDVKVLGFTPWYEHEIRAGAATGCAGLIVADPELAVAIRSRLADHA